LTHSVTSNVQSSSRRRASSLAAALSLGLRFASTLALPLTCTCRRRRLRHLLGEPCVRGCVGLGLCLRPHHSLGIRLYSLHGGSAAAESGRELFAILLLGRTIVQLCSPLEVLGRLLEIRGRARARLPSQTLAGL